MKKIFFLVVAVVSFLSFKSNNTYDLIGKWKGSDKKDIGYIIFEREGYASFEFQGQLLGGKEFEINGEKATMFYKVDDTKEPIALDFIMTKIKTGETRNLRCIIKWVTKDCFKMEIGFTEKYPEDFSDAVIIFNRVKE